VAANLLSFDFIRGRLSPEQLEEFDVEESHFEGHWQPGNTRALLKSLGGPGVSQQPRQRKGVCKRLNLIFRSKEGPF
jgi:hypothetical protein